MPIQPLAIIDSDGMLSDDSANEITPFIYRDKDGVEYLFFSSDRGGNYDVYYSRMSGSGEFYPPEALSNLIDTAGDEYSPAVYDYAGETYLSVLRSAGGTTNLFTYLLTNGFEPLMTFQYRTGDYVYCGVFYQESGISFYLVDKTNGVFHSTQFFMQSGWSGFTAYDLRPSFGISSIETFNISGSAGYARYSVYETQTNGYYQIAVGESVYIFPAVDYTGYGVAAQYLSGYNDRWPFVDYYDGRYELYYASDRYGLGNYDLYRYNSLTLDKVVLYNQLM